MQQTEHQESATAQDRRPVILLFLVLAVIAGGMFLYTSVFTPVGYDLRVEPPVLYAGSADSALLRAHGVNRLGGAVPFSQPRIAVHFEEGADLLSIAPHADSTVWVLRPRDRAGVALLRVETRAWPFPLLASVRVTVPMAQRSPSPTPECMTGIRQ